MQRYTAHPSVYVEDGTPRLKIFREFTADRSLPKYLTSDGKIVDHRKRTMSFDEYLRNSDRMSAYRRSSSRGATYVMRNDNFIKALFYRIKRWLTRHKVDPEDSVKAIKEMVQNHTLQPEAAISLAKIETLIKRLMDSGQHELAIGLQNTLPIVHAEATLVSLGYAKYLTEQDIIDVFMRANYGLRIDFVANYPEVFPKPVSDLKIKLDQMKIFDNWAVLHYDPTGTALRLIKEEERRRDPILFGMLTGSDRLYYITDWVIGDDDITLDKLCKEYGTTPKTVTRNIGFRQDDIIRSINELDMEMAGMSSDMVDPIEPEDPSR